MTQEILISELDPDKWLDVEKGGFRRYPYWVNEETGASIVLLDMPAGSGIPIKHSHASNQFMYCLEGEYEYTETGLMLRPGSFYMNPKGHPHGPTKAHTRCLLIEIYDGPAYAEVPEYHTKDSIGGAVAKD